MPSGEPELDLHGLRVAEALRRASSFLVHEQQRGTISVRIVTGHGTGALKSAVRDLLARHPAVASARPSVGTDAATLVVLKPPLPRSSGSDRSRAR
jgi:DNA mismatch repair protein MutS2